MKTYLFDLSDQGVDTSSFEIPAVCGGTKFTVSFQWDDIAQLHYDNILYQYNQLADTNRLVTLRDSKHSLQNKDYLDYVIVITAFTVTLRSQQQEWISMLEQPTVDWDQVTNSISVFYAGMLVQVIANSKISLLSTLRSEIDSLLESVSTRDSVVSMQKVYAISTGIFDYANKIQTEVTEYETQLAELRTLLKWKVSLTTSNFSRTLVARPGGISFILDTYQIWFESDQTEIGKVLKGVKMYIRVPS